MGIEDDIADLNRQLAELRRKGDLIEAELRGLERARQYIGASVPANNTRVASVPASPAMPAVKPATQSDAKRTGRQPGAISHRWRLILADLLVSSGDTWPNAWFDESVVAAAVERLEGRKIKHAEVRRQFEGYIAQRYIDKNEKGAFRVTEEAAHKLNLRALKTNEAAGTPSESAPAASVNPDAQGREAGPGGGP